MIKRFFAVVISFFVLINMVSCNLKKTEVNKDIVISSEECANVKKLVIYMNATTHSFLSRNAEGEEIITTIYPSRYTTGTMLSAGDVDSPNANIFEKALNEYAEKYDVHVEVHYLDGYEGGGDALQDIVDSDGKLPDLMIFNTQPHYDYYRLAEQGYLLDFSEYMAKDNDIVDEEIYYQRVIEGGKMFSGQYAIPLLFSMNAMMTSEEYLNGIGVSAPQSGSSPFDELIYIMEESCIEMAKDDTMEALHETSGSMLLGHYIPSILTAAAYPNYFDESGNILVSAEKVSNIFELMSYYNRQEFTPIIGWEENSYIENMDSGLSKSYQIPYSEEAVEYIGIFLSGGRSGGVGFYSSLLTDAAFMQTIYNEDEKQFVLCGIPTAESATEYSANITLAAYGVSTTEHPEEVYNLVRFLMDYEFPYQYGFSVNREITEKQLLNAQKTTISVYPESIWDGPNSVMTYEKLNSLIYHTEPLSSDNADIIKKMLDNIAGASVPYAVLEYNMYNSMLNMVGDGKMTPTEAGEWVVTQWNQYLNQLNVWEPFWDVNFNNSIRLYGDLPDE